MNARMRARRCGLYRGCVRSKYLRTHSCNNVANTADDKLSTRLANQNAWVPVGVDTGFGGVGSGGRPEEFALAWSW